MRKTAVLCTLALCVLAFAAADGAAMGPATLVVDGDGVECANADFTTIQAAVDAAQPGDLIRVCPDLYAESVVVDKPLTLRADPDAIEAIDCIQATLPGLSTERQAIVDPAGDGFTVAFTLAADDVVLEGFVVQGASVAIDTSDRFSGYRIDHNLLRLNTLFAIDFGSEGTHQSRVDHNCIRENRFGLVSELDSDSLWPDRGNRGPENARATWSTPGSTTTPRASETTATCSTGTSPSTTAATASTRKAQPGTCSRRTRCSATASSTPATRRASRTRGSRTSA